MPPVPPYFSETPATTGTEDSFSGSLAHHVHFSPLYFMKTEIFSPSTYLTIHLAVQYGPKRTNSIF